VFHPFVAGGVASVYIVGGRFHPAKNALVFTPNGGLEQPLTAEERHRYQKNLDDLLRAVLNEKPAPEGTSWRQFQQVAQPSLDPLGRPVLQAAIAQKRVSLGISRGGFFSHEPPSELQRELLVTRLRAELRAGRAPRVSNIELRKDWELLQRVIAAPGDGITAHAGWTQDTPW
jgi:hypothetical protein